MISHLKQLSRKGCALGVDEIINETSGLAPDEIEELKEEREARARAHVLEMVGDLPRADIVPPENILFVCRLNPVTTEEDLRIIFNRFGTIITCDIVRDQKTGDSLCYAFVEFSKKEECEMA
ncbi:hypothetical protein ACOME3_008238 [Neoechinorhynchus agilis]